MLCRQIQQAVCKIGEVTLVHPARGVWMQHLELHDADQLDDQVRAWLADAHANAG